MTDALTPQPSVPDLMEPLLGWRYWLVEPEPHRRSRYHLVSAFNLTAWVPHQALEAKHNVYNISTPPHVEFERKSTCGDQPPCRMHIPDSVPGCGIYAMRTPPLVNICASPGHIVAWGRVSLWGRYALHTHGMRAQYAYPERIVEVMAPTDGHYDIGRDLFTRCYDPDMEEFIGLGLSYLYGVPYDKENAEWKLAQRNAEVLQNRYVIQSRPASPYQISPARVRWTRVQLNTPIMVSQSQPSPPSATTVTGARDNTRMIFAAIDRLFGTKKAP